MELKNNYLNNPIMITSNNKNIQNPKLVETNVKIFFKHILKECNNYKMQNYNLYYNISIFIIFIVVLGITLYSRYKGNMSKEELYIKKQKEKEYIMSKLVYYNRANIQNNQRIRNNLITNLPDYSNHPEASLLHRKIYF